MFCVDVCFLFVVVRVFVFLLLSEKASFLRFPFVPVFMFSPFLALSYLRVVFTLSSNFRCTQKVGKTEKNVLTRYSLENKIGWHQVVNQSMKAGSRDCSKQINGEPRDVFRQVFSAFTWTTNALFCSKVGEKQDNFFLPNLNKWKILFASSYFSGSSQRRFRKLVVGLL